MRKINKKIWLLLLLVVPLAFILFKSCGKSKADIYEYSPVSLGEVSKTIVVNGSLELFDSYIVSSQVSGEVRDIFVDFNDVVAKGQKLAYIDSADIDQRALNYSDTMKKATYELESQKEFLETKRNLLAENLVSPKEFESAERSYQVALANFNSVKRTNLSLQQQQESKRIAADMSGVIIHIYVTQRQSVNIGTPVFLMTSSLRKMKLLISVDESDIGLVNKGQIVEFTVSAYPGKKFNGLIEQIRINPVKTNQLVSYFSVAVCENPESLLLPGMTASAVVKVDRKLNVMRVPNQALMINLDKKRNNSDDHYVWVKKSVFSKGKPVEKVIVQTGIEGDSFTEISSGDLHVGDQVLVEYYQKDVD